MKCEFLNPEIKPCVSYLAGGWCSLPHQFRCVEYVKRVNPAMSHSAMKDYCTCRRKYYLGYIQGIERVKMPLPIVLGDIVSQCLDVIHEGKDIRINSIINAYEMAYSWMDEVPDSLIILRGFMEAYQKLPVSEERGVTQYEWKVNDLDGVSVHGFMDMAVIPSGGGKGGYGYEFKYTGKPSSYTKFTLMDQLGLYFMGTSLERITVRCLQVPQLRKGKKEADIEFKKRVTNDVLSRPKHYVIDTNYWRNEFDLDGIKRRVNVIGKEIGCLLSQGKDAFYMTGDRGPCFDCWFLDICSTGVISDTLYKKRERRVDERTNKL